MTERGWGESGKNRRKALCHRHRRLPTWVGNRGKSGPCHMVVASPGQEGRHDPADPPADRPADTGGSHRLPSQPPWPDQGRRSRCHDLAVQRRGAGERAVVAHLQGTRPHARRAAARRRGIRHAGGDPLGRSGAGRCAGVRSRQPDGGRAGETVRLQQRLSRPLSVAVRRQGWRPLPAGGQPRVRQSAADVRRAEERARKDPRTGRGRDGGGRRLGGRDRPRRRNVEGRPRQQVQPPPLGQHADGSLRSRGGPRSAEDVGRSGRAQGAGHAQQLRRRQHAVGHVADLRGELQRLLRRRYGQARSEGGEALRPRPFRLWLGAPRRAF